MVHYHHRLEDLIVLQAAADKYPEDGRGLYYLGNLWYDKRQYKETVECWERSRDLAPELATVHRNLALAYYNKTGRRQEAVRELQQAFALDASDARVFMELDLKRCSLIALHSASQRASSIKREPLISTLIT